MSKEIETSLKTVSIFDKLDWLAIFLDDMEAIWVKRGGDPGMSDITKEKIINNKKAKVSGFFLCKNDKPVGVAWIEETSPSYGNISYHCLDEDLIPKLVTFSVEKGYLDNKLMELILIQDLAIYNRILQDLGMTENIRQRMSLWLDQTNLFEVDDGGYQFYKYGKESMKDASLMSFRAHQVSQDYVMYKDLMDPVRRIKLEERVFNEHYGPVIECGTLMACKGERMVGAVLVVEVECWGFEKVPWVFDISVEPEFQEQGLGRKLMEKSINYLSLNQYPVMGLAVTKNNHHAIKLYEKLGFQKTDDFYEYIREMDDE